ncbi:unnamed protein product [Gordionus sp. m RMFG-2023]|uniref:uncharacterized protein LOC135925370 isoform X2 n=1 Tax=Gordionus sp. m RMFG-2023 TaxID=3053472 RepID=UPI0030E1E4DF
MLVKTGKKLLEYGEHVLALQRLYQFFANIFCIVNTENNVPSYFCWRSKNIITNCDKINSKLCKYVNAALFNYYFNFMEDDSTPSDYICEIEYVNYIFTQIETQDQVFDIYYQMDFAQKILAHSKFYIIYPMLLPIIKNHFIKLYISMLNSQEMTKDLMDKLTTSFVMGILKYLPQEYNKFKELKNRNSQLVIQDYLSAIDKSCYIKNYLVFFASLSSQHYFNKWDSFEEFVWILDFLNDLNHADPSISTIKELDRLKDLSNYEHPLSNIKTLIVQILANIAYTNPLLQAQIIQKDGLQIILASSKFDHLNPFISQWCIFAIRNLCDNNEKAKFIIKQMNKIS